MNIVFFFLKKTATPANFEIPKSRDSVQKKKKKKNTLKKYLIIIATRNRIHNDNKIMCG